MDRREVIGFLGAASLAGLALSAHAGHEHHAHGSPSGGAGGSPFQALRDAAGHCVTTGQVCLSHCVRLLADGDRTMGDCAAAVNQMLALCTALQGLASQGSPLTPAMAKSRWTAAPDAPTRASRTSITTRSAVPVSTPAGTASSSAGRSADRAGGASLVVTRAESGDPVRLPGGGHGRGRQAMKRRSRRHGVRVWLLLSCIPLSGCVPNVATYYRPAVDGGRLSAGGCVPAKSVVTFGVLPLEARVVEGARDWFVLLDIVAPEGAPAQWQSFRFETAEFRVRDTATGVVLDGPAITVRRDDRVDTVEVPYRRAATGRPAWSVELMWPGRPPRRFELLFPPAAIDGVSTRFPRVRFERRTWVGASPFNC